MLKCISSPGAAAQAKIASSIIADIRSRAGEKPFDRAKVAVVLPDENLLLPMLYSFPEGMKDWNFHREFREATAQAPAAQALSSGAALFLP